MALELNLFDLCENLLSLYRDLSKNLEADKEALLHQLDELVENAKIGGPAYVGHRSLSSTIIKAIDEQIWFFAICASSRSRRDKR